MNEKSTKLNRTDSVTSIGPLIVPKMQPIGALWVVSRERRVDGAGANECDRAMLDTLTHLCELACLCSTRAILNGANSLWPCPRKHALGT